MWVHLTEQSAEILLNEEEVQTLVRGKEVIGAPSSMFLVGKRILIVRQAGIEEIRAREGETEKPIPGHSKEAGLAICKQLDIDPEKVLSINIFALHGTVVIKTVDGDVDCHLVEDRNADGELIFRIVKDEVQPTKALLQQIDELSETPHYPFGTTYQKDVPVYRYARAGERLRANKPVEPRAVKTLPTEISNDVIWGDVIPSRRSRPGPRTLGVPVVNVNKGLCCWILSWAM